MAPKVTVLMPAYNAERYLGIALESILAQTYRDFELLVIDDGSIDRTADIARSYRDSRVRLLQNDRNLGLIATLNFGLEQVRGQYVARMDADDVSLPGRFEAQVAFLDAHPQVAVVGCAVQLIDAQGAGGAELRFPELHDEILWRLCFASPIAHPAAMLRSSVLRELGGYSAGALHCEDYDLWWRISRVSRLANLPQVLIKLRKHEGNVTRQHAWVHDACAVEIWRREVGSLLGRTLTPDLAEAVMGRAPAAETLASEALEVLFAYARLRAAPPRSLAAEVVRWLDDPAAPSAGGRARLTRLRRVARSGEAARLRPSEKAMIARLAMGRALRITAGAGRRALLHAGRRTGIAAVHAIVPRSARRHFTRIYERNLFGSSESRSGEGSTLEQTATIAREIPKLLRELGARSLLDAPCGDFHWMRQVELGVDKYIGVDIVADLIEHDRTLYGAPGREFFCRDLITDPLPTADVVLCRDCLVHLNSGDALAVLANFRRSGSRMLLTTTFTGRSRNEELSGDMVWRTLNLQRPPFNFPEPLSIINEHCTEGGGAYADKCLGLWRLEDLPV